MSPLPLSKQLIAAAVIAIAAPSATVIAAKNFETFLDHPRFVQFAQEHFTPPVSGDQNAPMSGGGSAAPQPAMGVPSQGPSSSFAPMPGDRFGAQQPMAQIPGSSGQGMQQPGMQQPVPFMGGEGGSFSPPFGNSMKPGEQQPNGQTFGQQGSGMMPQQGSMPSSGGGFGFGGPGDAKRDERMDQQRMGAPEDEARMQEEGERREREQKERMLKDMQRNLRGMEQGLSMMTKGLRVCATAKVAVPDDVSSGISRMKDMIAKVKSAKSADEIEGFDFSEFAEVGDQVRELIDQCHRLRELPRITKQLANELRRIESEFRSVSSQAKRSKVDVSELLAKVTQGIADIKATIAAVASVKSGDGLDEAMEQLEGLRDRFDEIREDMNVIRAVVNITRGLTGARREVKDAERQIGLLKRRGLDTSELERLLGSAKETLVRIEVLAKQKPIDVDALIAAFEELEDIGGQADDEFARVQGKRQDEGAQFGKSPASDLKLDVFEQFRGPSSAPAPEGAPF